VTSASSISGKKQTLYSSSSHKTTPYRIPAIATLKNGTILTIADHRPSGYDVGANSNNGKVDIYARIGSIDPNGNYTWTANNDIVNYTGSDKIQIANGDSSYGYGICPDKWNPPVYNDRNMGYAGGLSPENVAQNLEKISQVVPKDYTTWIDAEGKLMKPNSRTWDMKNVTNYVKNALAWEASQKTK
jgi:hypothetical protein